MKKLIMFIMVLGIGLFVAVPVQAGLNLIPNPGFEDDIDDNSVPDNWATWPPGTVTYHEDDGTSKSGTDCVELASGAAGYSVAHTDPDVAVVQGQEYTVAGWIAWALTPGAGTQVGGFKIEWYINDGDPYDNRISENAFDFDVSESGDYAQFVSTPTTPPATANYARVTCAMTGAAGTKSFYYDEMYFGIGPPPLGTEPYDPNPCNGCFAHPDTNEVSWTNPEPRQPGDTITCDVWFDRTASGDANNMTLIADDISDNFVTLSTIPGGLGGPINLVSGNLYTWRVDCNDPNGTGPPIPIEGPVWTFNTTNTPPIVEAGIKQAAWLSGGTVTVQLDATVTDDGLPDPPGQLSLKWDKLTGPDTPSFDVDTTEDPQVTFDTAGDYTLRLTADDTAAAVPGSSDPDDTVLIKIYAEGYTGLVAHWPFDSDNLNDIIGGHHGTLVDAGGGGAAYVTGRNDTGRGIDLEGGDYIRITDSYNGSSWAYNITDEITVSAWVKHTGADGDDVEKEWQSMVAKGDATSWQLSRNGWGGDGYFASAGLVPYAVNGTTTLFDNKWHHVVGTYDGVEISLYVDGIQQNSTDSTGSIDPNTLEIYIGANPQESDREWGGIIDEVRIYEIGLPADRVLQQFRDDGGVNSCAEPLPGDVNGDCYVNFLDIGIVGADWAECNDVGGTCQANP